MSDESEGSRRDVEPNDDRRLSHHTPSRAAIRRAREAGFDLAALRSDDPQTYRMICSVPVLRTDAELRGLAEGPLQVALGDQHLFEAEVQDGILIMAFPGPDRSQLQRLDDLLAAVVEEEARRRFGYFRVVQDRSGTRRELALPTEPESWSGRDTMVGPFADEAQAEAWAASHVNARSGATYDVLRYAGAWFCDVFSAAET
ncbi:MAG: hypothetical protein WD314_05800 [Trueperaceae bacterium]